MDHFLHIIVNQQSRNSDVAFKQLLIELPNYTSHYKIHITDNIEQLEKLMIDLKEAINPDDIIVIVGGDGGLNQTVTFLEKYDFKNFLGYIPSGSGNDFARSQGIPIKTKDAIAHLFSIKKPTELAIIHATQGDIHQYAVNSLGIGIDGLVIYKTTKDKGKSILGPFSYITKVLSAFAKQDKFPVSLKVDDGVYHFDNVQLALVANQPYFGGGIMIAPNADGADDVLEVIIADDVSAGSLLNILRRILGKKNHYDHPNIHAFQTKQVAIFTEATEYAQKDGECFQQDGYAYTMETTKRSFWI